LNDPEVLVSTHKGLNKLVQDPDGNVIPWQSQRIDKELTSYYASHTRGKIVDGVLVTEPVDMDWHHKLGVGPPGYYQINGMRFQLKLTPTGAEGLVIGYFDIPQFWEVYTKNAIGADWIGRTSGPSVYAALVRYADGDKDPETGQCNAISTAQEVGFARAFIVHPEDEGKSIESAAATSPLRPANAGN
jgi:hypothetical protein